MLTPGDIVHYKNFRFENGTIKNKYFVLLHIKPWLMLAATSQSLRYPMVNKFGCDIGKQTFFFPLGTCEAFTKPTYLALPKIWEIHDDQWESLITKKRIEKIFALKANQLDAIPNCVSHFREDISDEHWEFIFRPGAPDPSSLDALKNKFAR